MAVQVQLGGICPPEFVQYSSQYSCVIAIKLFLRTLSQWCIHKAVLTRPLHGKKLRFILSGWSYFNMIDSQLIAVQVQLGGICPPEFVQYSSQYSCVIAIKLFLRTLSQWCIHKAVLTRPLHGKKLRFILSGWSYFNMIDSQLIAVQVQLGGICPPEFVQYSSQYSCVIAIKLFLRTLSQWCIHKAVLTRPLHGKKLRFILSGWSYFNMIDSQLIAVQVQLGGICPPEFVQYSSQYSCVIAIKLFLRTLSQWCIHKAVLARPLHGKKLRFILSGWSYFNMIDSQLISVYVFVCQVLMSYAMDKMLLTR